MLPKENRILKKEDFQKAWKGGQSFYTKNLGFKLLNNKTPSLRLGVIVGNRISKLATARNKIKRRVREIIRLNKEKIIPGYDLVIIALPDILKKSFEEIEKDILFALNRFKIIKK
jgi:ribonuclease P protein component